MPRSPRYLWWQYGQVCISFHGASGCMPIIGGSGEGGRGVGTCVAASHLPAAQPQGQIVAVQSRLVPKSGAPFFVLHGPAASAAVVQSVSPAATPLSTVGTVETGRSSLPVRPRPSTPKPTGPPAATVSTLLVAARVVMMCREGGSRVRGGGGGPEGLRTRGLPAPSQTWACADGCEALLAMNDVRIQKPQPSQWHH